ANGRSHDERRLKRDTQKSKTARETSRTATGRKAWPRRPPEGGETGRRGTMPAGYAVVYTVVHFYISARQVAPVRCAEHATGDAGRRMVGCRSIPASFPDSIPCPSAPCPPALAAGPRSRAMI